MFAGTGTALITPFGKDGSIDEEALRRLVDFQESNGVDVLLACGSTGESATMCHEEHLRTIEIVRDQAKKAKVLAGAGSNCTREAVELSKGAQDIGADGILSISPYYVKPTQEGIYQHYSAMVARIIDKIADINVIIYSISTSLSTVAFLVHNNDVKQTLRQLNGLSGGDIERIDVKNDVALICAVGDNLLDKCGVSGDIFGAVKESNANVEMISEGASDVSLNFVVPMSKVIDVVRTLHEKFIGDHR